MVPTTGLEPILSPLLEFSALPVVASCVMSMPLHIRFIVFVCNINIASTGKARKKSVCNSVRDVRCCADLCGSQNLCNSVRMTRDRFQPFMENFLRDPTHPAGWPSFYTLLLFVRAVATFVYGGPDCPVCSFFCMATKIWASIFKWCYPRRSGRTADVQPARRISGA